MFKAYQMSMDIEEMLKWSCRPIRKSNVSHCSPQGMVGSELEPRETIRRASVRSPHRRQATNEQQLLEFQHVSDPAHRVATAADSREAGGLETRIALQV